MISATRGDLSARAAGPGGTPVAADAPLRVAGASLLPAPSMATRDKEKIYRLLICSSDRPVALEITSMEIP